MHTSYPDGVRFTRVIRETVDRFWSEWFAVPASELREPGSRVVVDPPGLAGNRRVFLLRFGDGCTIGVLAQDADRVTQRATGCAPDELFRPDAARDLAGAEAALVLGPSIHAYLDASTFVPQDPCDARRLGPDDAAAIDGLRADVDPDEWAEGGFGDPLPEIIYGSFADTRLLAMGNMTDFSGHDAGNDLGLVTHPTARGQGHGPRLAGAMIADSLAAFPVIRYRALETNLASRAVCRKLGFVDDGANIAVRFGSPEA